MATPGSVRVLTARFEAMRLVFDEVGNVDSDDDDSDGEAMQRDDGGPTFNVGSTFAANVAAAREITLDAARRMAAFEARSVELMHDGGAVQRLLQIAEAEMSSMTALMRNTIDHGIEAINSIRIARAGLSRMPRVQVRTGDDNPSVQAMMARIISDAEIEAALDQLHI
jgi:hypothetical protein